MNIAIIPAREGSKRIPKKNIRNFFGKPMISYSIEAAKKSNVFDQILVSTDSEEIAEISLRYGAKVPALRPKEISDDFTPLAVVLKHALENFIPENKSYDLACCILATSPLLKSEFLIQGRDLIQEKKCSTVVSVTSFEYPIFRGLKINPNGYLQMIWPEHELTRSNDLPRTFHDAGQFYWTRINSFLKNPRLFSTDAAPLVLPRYLVQDIDTPEEWDFAEKLFETFK